MLKKILSIAILMLALTVTLSSCEILFGPGDDFEENKGENLENDGGSSENNGENSGNDGEENNGEKLDCNGEHAFAEEWILDELESTACDKHYYRYCINENCNYCENKNVDGHEYVNMYDRESHWTACKNCELAEGWDMHSYNGTRECTKCDFVHDVTSRIVYTLSDDGTYAIVSEYKGADFIVFIESEYEGVPVTHIGDRAFKDKGGVHRVILPNSITTIGDCAFNWCWELEWIYIPDSLRYIGYGAFSGTRLFENIELGNSVEYIGDSAFLDTHISSITIPDSVKYIGSFAFAHTGIQSVTIPDSVTEIGAGAFAGCEALDEVIFEDPYGWYFVNLDGTEGPPIPSVEFEWYNRGVEILKDESLEYSGLAKD